MPWEPKDSILIDVYLRIAAQLQPGKEARQWQEEYNREGPKNSEFVLRGIELVQKFPGIIHETETNLVAQLQAIVTAKNPPQVSTVGLKNTTKPELLPKLLEPSFSVMQNHEVSIVPLGFSRSGNFAAIIQYLDSKRKSELLVVDLSTDQVLDREVLQKKAGPYLLSEFRKLIPNYDTKLKRFRISQLPRDLSNNNDGYGGNLAVVAQGTEVYLS